FRTRGGYILSLSPELSRLERRCLGFDRAQSPIVFMVTWCKPIDTVHPLLRKLEEYSRQPIAPFHLDGAVYPGPLVLPSDGSSCQIRPVPGLRPLLKFEVTFVDEENVQSNT